LFSTGGRQGLRMAQDFPYDYDGILAGAPAIHWDRFQAGQIWYQTVMGLRFSQPNFCAPVDRHSFIG
jgi:feruloyl esterase